MLESPEYADTLVRQDGLQIFLLQAQLLFSLEQHILEASHKLQDVVHFVYVLDRFVAGLLAAPV